MKLIETDAPVDWAAMRMYPREIECPGCGEGHLGYYPDADAYQCWKTCGKWFKEEATDGE